MKQIEVVLLILVLFCGACDGEKVESYDYYKFSKQITPSGRYAIYDYARYGPMAFSSDISGTELFEIDEEFEEGKGKRINGAVSEWISNDTLLTYRFKSGPDQPKDTLPIKTEFSQLGDFIVKTIYYDRTNFGHRVIEKFDSVSTTNDSIFIRTISDKGVHKFLMFPLGATTIKTKSNSVVHVAVHTRLTKNMHFTCKNPDGSYKRGLPGIGTVWYDLTPSKKISPKELNEKKIYWERL